MEVSVSLERRALERLRVDFAYNLQLLAERDAELDGLWAAQREAVAARARALAERDAAVEAAAAAEASFTEAEARLSDTVNDLRQRALAAELRADAAEQRAQSAAQAAQAAQAAEAPSPDASALSALSALSEEAHQLRSDNARLRRAVQAMRTQMEGAEASASVQERPPLERLLRDNVRLRGEKELLMDLCNALRGAGGSPCVRMVAEAEEAVAVVAPRKALRVEANSVFRPPPLPLPPPLLLAGAAAVAAPRPVARGASERQTESQAQAAKELRERRRKRQPPLPRVRNWAKAE